MGRTLLLLATLSVVGAVFADAQPTLRKGLWEFKRTMVGQGPGGKDAELTNKKCTDPVVDMKVMSGALAQQGCRAAPAALKANVLTSAWECTINGVPVKSERVTTFAGDSAYMVNVTTTGGGKTSREVLVARRLGDC